MNSSSENLKCFVLNHHIPILEFAKLCTECRRRLLAGMHRKLASKYDDNSKGQGTCPWNFGSIALNSQVDFPEHSGSAKLLQLK